MSYVMSSLCKAHKNAELALGNMGDDKKTRAHINICINEIRQAIADCALASEEWRIREGDLLLELANAGSKSKSKKQ